MRACGLIGASSSNDPAGITTMSESLGSRGKRRLSKRGPTELRRLLYLAALSAIKTKTWRPLYEHYRAKGLSSTGALVILARRIARTAWSIYAYKTEFDPARLKNPVLRTH
jgi:transposase